METILIGFKNVGKTTLGEKLALAWGVPFIDTDREIEKKYCREKGKSLPFFSIYEKEGELFFRELEKKVISQLPKRENQIISLGGGAFLEEANKEFMKKRGKVIFLDLPKEVLQSRFFLKRVPSFVKGEDPLESFSSLFEKRRALYQACSDLTIALLGSSVEEDFLEIKGKIESFYGK